MTLKHTAMMGSDMSKKTKLNITDSEWKEKLTDEQYYITRKHGTERAFSHACNDEKRQGEYKCVCCGEILFLSNSKYDSGSGWPSFFQPANKENISEYADNSLFMRRTEVRCSSCDAHLGHVFEDGPQPTGLRYCINGLALDFVTGNNNKDKNGE